MRSYMLRHAQVRKSLVGEEDTDSEIEDRPTGSQWVTCILRCGCAFPVAASKALVLSEPSQT